MESTLSDLVTRLRSRLEAGQFQTEASVREAIVLPILQLLGWDTLDPTSVIREYSLAQRRVDYALSSSSGRVEIFLEVKAPGLAAGADRQLFEYAFHAGIPFAILTDGREWSFYLPGEQGNYDERRVQKVDLVDRDLTAISSAFDRYLSYNRVRDGSALSAARSDYQSISKRKNAALEIPRAWHDLVTEPDALLMDLIGEKAEALCGYRPASEDVEAFLLSLLRGPRQPIDAERSELPKLERSARAVTTVSDRAVNYQVLGRASTAPNAIDALIDILRTLINRNPTLTIRLADAVRGRTRNHIAKSRYDVYPGKPDLTEYTVELVPGWWIGTNIANREKMRILQRAAELEGLKVGKDIVITLPNTG